MGSSTPPPSPPHALVPPSPASSPAAAPRTTPTDPAAVRHHAPPLPPRRSRTDPSDRNEASDDRVESPDADAEERLNRKLEKLWDVCNVLGILYKSKLAKFGSVVTEERVDETIKFLTVTRDSNFKKLKEISEEMIKAWKQYNTNIAKVQMFSWIFLIREAEKAEEIMEWNVLSTETVAKADREVCRLVNERERLIQKRYNTKKSKLKKMLAEAHLTAEDIGYEMVDKVTTKEYTWEKGLVKCAIKDIKEAFAKRRELVVRVEMAKRAVHNKNMSPEDKHTMISYAEKVVGRMKSNNKDQPIPYDGQLVEAILKDLCEDAAVSKQSNETEDTNETEEVNETEALR